MQRPNVMHRPAERSLHEAATRLACSHQAISTTGADRDDNAASQDFLTTLKEELMWTEQGIVDILGPSSIDYGVKTYDLGTTALGGDEQQWRAMAVFTNNSRTSDGTQAAVFVSVDRDADGAFDEPKVSIAPKERTTEIIESHLSELSPHHARCEAVRAWVNSQRPTAASVEPRVRRAYESMLNHVSTYAPEFAKGMDIPASFRDIQVTSTESPPSRTQQGPFSEDTYELEFQASMRGPRDSGVAPKVGKPFKIAYTVASDDEAWPKWLSSVGKHRYSKPTRVITR